MTPNTDDPPPPQPLRERGQRVTPQRLVINRLLRERDRHVSADELLDAVEERLPNVSLPTVYSTLELFEELGLVRRVGSAAGRVLWASRRAHHRPAARSPVRPPPPMDVPVAAAASRTAAPTA